MVDARPDCSLSVVWCALKRTVPYAKDGAMEGIWNDAR